MNAVLLIGAGLAGTRAAETLRTEGYDGNVTLIGDEPVAPYERPALSKQYLEGTRGERSLLLRQESYWADRAIELILGDRVVGLDPVARTARTRGGRTLHFTEALLATGARPRRLPLDRPSGVHELRTLADARALREDLIPGARLVVVGGGFVGAEVASTARQLGVEVTILEAAAAPVARVLGEKVGLLLAEHWRGHGVDVRLRTGIAHIRADAGGRVSSVLLTDGTDLRADAVLIAVGVEPVRELVPERPAVHIRAAGDVVGPGHWTAASWDGAAAARRVLRLSPPAPQPSYVWSDQFGLRLQIVGTPEPHHALEVDGDAGSFVVRYLDHDGATGAALFANRPAEAAGLRRRLADETVALAA